MIVNGLSQVCITFPDTRPVLTTNRIVAALISANVTAETLEDFLAVWKERVIGRAREILGAFGATVYYCAELTCVPM